jgi:hypothetical protein
MGNLTQTTYFSAMVQSGVCAAVNSAAVTVTVDAVSRRYTNRCANNMCSGTHRLTLHWADKQAV